MVPSHVKVAPRREIRSIYTEINALVFQLPKAFILAAVNTNVQSPNLEFV